MDTDHEDDEEEKEMTYITKDTVRKHQFDHNRNTCMTKNYPEMFADENGQQIKSRTSLAFAIGIDEIYKLDILNNFVKCQCF